MPVYRPASRHTGLEITSQKALSTGHYRSESGTGIQEVERVQQMGKMVENV
jgi:hypothetical protein